MKKANFKMDLFMDNAKANIETIERYLTNEMSNEERLAFMKLLDADKDLQKETAELGTLILGIRQSEREKLQERFNEIEKELPEIQSTKKVSIFRRKGIQMAIAALIVIVFGLFYILSPTSSDKVYNDYFDPYPNIIHGVVRSNTDDLSIEQKAYYYYEAGNYTEAIVYFDELLLNDNSVYPKFYKAISLMSLEEFQKAITILENISNNTELELQINWYLALCYLRSNREESAKAMLEEIANSTNSYSAKATSILKEF